MTNIMYSPSLLQEQEHVDEQESRDEQHVDDEELPSEAQFVLLCLDHLRDLRRAYPNKQDLLQTQGLDADYLSVAIYALSRVFVEPPELSHFENGNDAYLDWERANNETCPIFPVKDPPSSKNFISIPNLQSINQEIFYSSSDEQEYIYNDGHPSNAHRFYPLDGLASGPLLRDGPLTLGELAVAGLAGLGARSRIAAELDVRESPLFHQFVAAVRSKGFFRDPDTEQPKSDPDEEKERLARAAELQNERLGKVMGKVRTKLAHKAQQQLNDNVGDVPPLYHDYFVMSAGERLEQRRHMTHHVVPQGSNGDTMRPPPRPPSTTTTTSVYSSSRSSPTSSPELVRRPSPSKRAQSPAGTTTTNMALSSPALGVNKTLSMDSPGLQRVSSSTVTSPIMNTKSQKAPPSPQPPPRAKSPMAPDDNPADIAQAERLKTVGNAHMQNKEYTQAAEAYTAALASSPNGPHTHVYYSNRAAALLSMKRFDEAIADSERSLALQPQYGKAHARLGLAHFLLGNYRLAVQAYTISLKYEPDNKSTKNYLQKAAKRAAALEASESNHAASEQERSDAAKQKSKSSNSPGLPMAEENDKRNNKVREKEAEKVKLKGNSYMANRDYEAALTNYTLAIKLSPEGPNSHVYYSNRAAALCYLERYEEAEADSEYSLMLNPTYGKAHARLGLSRFFMGDYAGAIDAYNSALEYDPDNAASKSYLAKARARLAKQSGNEARLMRKAPKPVTSPAIPSSKDSFDEIMNASIAQADATTAAEI